MNANILVIALLLSLSFSLKSQEIETDELANFTYRPSFIEFETGMRDELIFLDTLVIEQVVSTLSNEGCTNLNYFLEEFHTVTSYRDYPIGFNFAKFSGGFGDELKKEICRTLAAKNMCIDQIIENVFAHGRCFFDDMPINCHPIAKLIFNDKDTVVINRIKELIATKGYRITYNDNHSVLPFHKRNINRTWIKLFSAKELSSIDEEQEAYLRGLVSGQN
jgi:hypothetical protein